LAQALIIAIEKLTNGPNDKAYRQGRKIGPKVQELLATTGINLDNGGGIPELNRFQERFQEYKVVVYSGLHCNEIVYEARAESCKLLNLRYVNLHYHVIVNLTEAIAKRYICKV
jgi:hypothetical protein